MLEKVTLPHFALFNSEPGNRHVLLPQLVGGRLAEVYGAKLVYGVSLLGTAVLSLLSPSIAREAG